MKVKDPQLCPVGFMLEEGKVSIYGDAPCHFQELNETPFFLRHFKTHKPRGDLVEFFKRKDQIPYTICLFSVYPPL